MPLIYRAPLHLVRSHAAIAKFNNVLCVVLVVYVGVLLFCFNGFNDVVSGNLNGFIQRGAVNIGWPKGQLSAITGYCVIWLVMMRRRIVHCCFIVFVMPILMAGRSVAVALVATFMILIGFSKILKSKIRISIFLSLFVIVLIVPSFDLNKFPALHYDRAANFKVAVEMADDHFFGYGNGAYHLYVERNQTDLNNKYRYLFSKYQVEVFRGPESMFNHIIGSFGYFLGLIFFTLQAISLWCSYAIYHAADKFEQFVIVFWIFTLITGIGQTSIMMGFPYFFVWAFVVGICIRRNGSGDRSSSAEIAVDVKARNYYSH